MDARSIDEACEREKLRRQRKRKYILESGHFSLTLEHNYFLSMEKCNQCYYSSFIILTILLDIV